MSIKIKHKYLTKQGYVVDINSLSKEDILEIKTELTVKPNTPSDYNANVESFQVFKQIDNLLYVPKFYGIQKLGKPIKKIALEGVKTQMKFKGKLRDHQQGIADKCLKILKTDEGGIISIPCGGGKTVLGIYLACMLGLKTLVVVNKTFLQDQWIERIQQFCDAKIGIIRQKKIKTDGMDIVIAMLQSTSQIDYDLKIFEPFGCVIYDECAHLGAQVFSRAMYKTGAKYTIGLSATPDRADGLTKVINWYIGDIIHREERRKDNKVLVKLFDYESDSKLFQEKKRYINKKVNPDVVKMVSNMSIMDDRNKFITDIMASLMRKKGRKIIVLSGRIEHLRRLKTSLDKTIERMVAAEICEEGEFKTSYYIGKMKSKELAESTESDVIFGSYAMAEEGLDIDGLNTLILATPKKDIIQSLGRIMRKPIEEGDLYPLVVDIADQFSCFSRWSEKRLDYYQKNKYKIDKFIGFSDRCISVKEYLGKKKIKIADDDIKKAYMMYRFGEDLYDLYEDASTDGADEFDYNYDPDFNCVFGDPLDVDV